MNLLLDTNILVFITRARNFSKIIDFINPEHHLIYISVVSEAEINSIAIQNKWGIKRLEYLNLFLKTCSVVDINQSLVKTYAEIDSYSQCENPNFTDYPFKSARNMGKNDLWIASLARLLNLKLVTTDFDFDHLHNVFFEVRRIDAIEFRRFR